MGSALRGTGEPGSIARSEPIEPTKACEPPRSAGDRQSHLSGASLPDRRRHPRHDVMGHCWIDAPDLTLFGPTHDIGAGGLFVRTAAKLPLGTPVEVRLRMPGEDQDVLAQALVARCVPIGFGPPCHGLALSFVRIARGLSLLRSALARTTPALG